MRIGRDREVPFGNRPPRVGAVDRDEVGSVEGHNELVPLSVFDPGTISEHCHNAGSLLNKAVVRLWHRKSSWGLGIPARNELLTQVIHCRLLTVGDSFDLDAMLVAMVSAPIFEVGHAFSLGDEPEDIEQYLGLRITKRLNG